LFIGSRGMLVHDTYGNAPRLLLEPSPKEPAPAASRPQPHTSGHHELRWVEAAKGNRAAASDFDQAARLTELMLLGVLSLRAGAKIDYDAARLCMTSPSTANDLIDRPWRRGW
jgi:hypothetical protein